MIPVTLTAARQGILRYSRWDALLIVLAMAHGALLVIAPLAPVIALALWWNSNTISHNFIHKPFFRPRPLNTLFALYLTVLLGIPQSIWRSRHLAHHAGVVWRPRISRRMIIEVALVLSLWATLLALHARFFLTIYLPGYVVGLVVCAVHGYYEHVRGTISHYGILYNLLFFNDGLHVEHHAHPGIHWTRLAEQVQAGAKTSRWPAVLRWLDGLSLEMLERWVLRSTLLQWFVLNRHEKAFRKLLPHFAAARRVGIIGGGLFPRTLRILQRLLPGAQLVVIDRSAENLATARRLIDGEAQFINDCYDPGRMNGFDLVVIPLAFVGDREAVYRYPPAPLVVIHDWIWRRREPSVVVSVLLLKRLNLVRP